MSPATAMSGMCTTRRSRTASPVSVFSARAGKNSSSRSAFGPRYTPGRTRPSSPIRSIPMTWRPNRRSHASMIFSNTGAASATELLITPSTSAVAVCCSSASRVSLKSRALCSAIVACRDKPTRNSSSRGSNGLPPMRQTAIAPCTLSFDSSGTTIRRSSSPSSVPEICIARGSAAVLLIRSGRPVCSRLPIMPTPGSTTVALIFSAMSPRATLAR